MNVPLSPLKQAYLAIEGLEAKLEAVERTKNAPIAVVGIGCRLPGSANDPEAFWQNLKNGVDGVREVPPDRWDVNAVYDPDPNAPGKSYVRQAGFIDRVDGFDPQFFGIAPREAIAMDPQQRLLLEVVWEALENAAIAPDSLAGSRTGVFVGIASADYFSLYTKTNDLSKLDTYYGSGISHSIASGRISYILGLQGPSISLDTACSSSLVATHLAVQSLRSGESDLALACGVNLILLPDNQVSFSKLRMLAFDGRCKTFDASADGFGDGEGCGVVVLKRLTDALTGGDRILAVIRGSAINQDGASSGLTAPNGPSQEAVIRAALTNGGIRPAEVGYIEAHGTGTSLGDPIEVRSLSNVLKQDRPVDHPFYLGSVKTNLGHLEAAAGVAGLIKAILVVQHGEIPPHLNYETPNPLLDWDTIPAVIPTRLAPWPSGYERRVAGVSAFGFSGTNVHVVLEEPPSPQPSPMEGERPVEAQERPLHILTLSAKNEAALRELAGLYQKFAQDHAIPTILPDLAFTANTGRAKLPARLAIVAEDILQAQQKMAAFLEGQDLPGLIRGDIYSGDPPKVAFLFTGQGAQYVGMGRQLYETQPTFRAAMDRCEEALQPILRESLLSMLYPNAGINNQQSKLDHTAFTQPALFAIEYSLAEVWKSWGVVPSAVMGHSVGEYVAAVLAGVFSLEDGLKLIAARGRLMGALPEGGAMAAVFAPAEHVQAAIKNPLVSIAAVNGPDNTVISGDQDAVQEVIAAFKAEGIKARPLKVSHAFHSPLMDPILDEFERIAAQVTYTAPVIRLVSDVTGEFAKTGQVTNARYWRDHVRQPVQFMRSIETLYRENYDIFLEIGPSPTLTGMGQRILAETSRPILWASSLKQNQDEWGQMLASLGMCFCRGVAVDWSTFDKVYPRTKLALPTYPFQRARYWADFKLQATLRQHSAAGHPLLGQRLRSPSKTITFENWLSTSAFSFLNDHRVFGTAILPGTGFIELALAAAYVIFGDGPHGVEDLTIYAALIVEEDEERLLHVMVSPGEGDSHQFEVFTQGDESSSWVLHASGTLIRSVGGASPQAPAIAEIQARCAEIISAEAHYQRLAENGLAFGESLKGVAQIWRRDGEALGFIRPTEAVNTESGYLLHPALLDAHLQGMAAALPSSSDVYLPFHIEKIQRFGATQPVWSYIQIADASSHETVRAQLTLLDEAGQVVTQISSITLKRIDHTALLKAGKPEYTDWLYRVAWQPVTRTQALPSGANSLLEGNWLVIGDPNGLGVDLVERLRAAGASCILADAASEEFPRRVADSIPLKGVIHLGDTRSALATVQALITLGDTLPHLWLVTSGAQPAGNVSNPDPAQAELWGFGRTVALEHPELSRVQIDLDPADPHPAESLLAEIATPTTDEDQIALRGNERLAARLARLPSPLAPDPSQVKTLTFMQPGALDSLAWLPAERGKPGSGEVEIRVQATSLNFKDMMMALGMYPGATVPLGGECSGVITAMGEGVTGLQVGDPVMAIAPGSFSTHVIANAAYTARQPANLIGTQTASAFIPFITADFTLNHLGQMKPGEKVLIHAGAGGVGLAAVQLAQRAGLEIFATAGSPEKRAYLKSLGVPYVMDSRTLAFADEIMQITGGRGVDLVLNSLAGDFIPKSLSVLAENGRFLEIGKSGLLTPEQVAALGRGIRYFIVDWSEEALRQPGLIIGILRKIVADLSTGALHPLPVRVFPMDQVEAAFRYMQQARHIGKIVITQPPDRAIPLVRSDATYLITGGLRGLGLLTARWLADQGARSLALIGRNPPTPEVKAILQALEAAGVHILVAQVDVSQEGDLRQVLDKIRQEMPPVRGIIHAAGLLDDASLINQNWERFETVYGPKVTGATLLHRLTDGEPSDKSKEIQPLPVDFFVLYSSVASVFGSPGQANYAAANASMDALAYLRHSQGLPALSINWGVWAEVGVAAERGIVTRSAEQGIESILPEEGLNVLGELMHTSTNQAVVSPMNWPIFLEGYGEHVPPFLRIIADEVAQRVVKTAARATIPEKSSAPSQPGFLRQLAEAPADRKNSILLSFVQAQAARVLGLEPRSVNERIPLSDMGLDSLMAVELRNLLGTALVLKRPLPVTLVFDYPTVQAISDYLMKEVLKLEEAMPAAEPIPMVKGERGALEAIEELSDNDVDRRLQEILESQR